ncbi:MAG: hypothetical protein R3C03_21585 [Pirellulaceae bacterium]
MDSNSATMVWRCNKCCLRNLVPTEYLGLPCRCKHCGCVASVVDEQSESAALDDPIRYSLEFNMRTDEFTKPDLTSRPPR